MYPVTRNHFRGSLKIKSRRFSKARKNTVIISHYQCLIFPPNATPTARGWRPSGKSVGMTAAQ